MQQKPNVDPLFVTSEGPSFLPSSLDFHRLPEGSILLVWQAFNYKILQTLRNTSEKIIRV